MRSRSQNMRASYLKRCASEPKSRREFSEGTLKIFDETVDPTQTASLGGGDGEKIRQPGQKISLAPRESAVS